MAVLYHKDRVRQAVSAGGAGALTLGSASSGYRALVVGDDGRLFPYIIEDGAAWETGYGTYTHSGTSFARTTRHDSSSGGALTVTTAAYVMVGWTATLGASFTDFRSVFGQDEISITTTATLTLNRMHVCSGTTADYTATLPAASGNAGALIGVRMATGLTKVVTIDGNAAETIDGATTRIMWASESAILLCDGSNWFKVAGNTIPMIAVMAHTGNQSFGPNTLTKITGFTVVEDSVGMANTAGNRIEVRRPGRYRGDATLRFSSTPATEEISRNLGQLQITGVLLTEDDAYSYATGIVSVTPNKSKSGVTTSDYLELYGYHNRTLSGSHTTQNVAGVSHLSLTEIPSW